MDAKAYPRWQSSYLTLLAQRDLPAWGLPAKPQVISRLLKMVAAVNGQAWNASQLGQSLGLDYKTVNSYLDYLTGTFLVRRLLPYQTNMRKRLVKTPKVYWRDSGLLHAMLNVVDSEHLLSQPWVGASWEGFVVEQTIGLLLATGRQFDAFYFRTSDRHEIDLVLDLGGKLWAVEIKLTSAVAFRFIQTGTGGGSDRRKTPNSRFKNIERSGEPNDVFVQSGGFPGNASKSRRIAILAFRLRRHLLLPP